MTVGAIAQEAAKAPEATVQSPAPAASASAQPVASAAASTPTTNPADLKELRPGVLPGYLPREQLIDSLALLGPAPAPDSMTAKVDEAIRIEVQKLKDTPRYKVAARDAVYKTPAVVDAFSCALGIRISQAATPHLNMLMRRTLTDAGLATYKAKTKYLRPRPYVASNDNATCYPADEEALRKDGSYPSGHAAFGWAWALILAEASPEAANAIIKRGYDYGQSRVICGFHWQSDVNAGRVIGAAVVAQLHANPEFQAQFAEAKKEIARARADDDGKPDCTLDQAVASGD